MRRLKAIPRSGWLSHGVHLQDVESVADHSFSVCALSLLLADLESKRGVRVNVERVLRMAILHDISESLTFDISKAYLQYLGRKGEVMKGELEHAAWMHLAKGIGNKVLAREYTRLQSEYVADETLESKIVHAADGLDILLQLMDYRQKGYSENVLADLWNGTVNQLRRSEVRSACEALGQVVAEARRSRRRRRIR